jgi:hypothetical protein
VAIRNDAKETSAANQLIKTALIAELTWAKLYTKTMHRDLGDISTAVSKRQSPASGSEMKKSAEKLHDQLQSANRTVGELAIHTGTRLALVKKWSDPNGVADQLITIGTRRQLLRAQLNDTVLHQLFLVPQITT